MRSPLSPPWAGPSRSDFYRVTLIRLSKGYLSNPRLAIGLHHPLKGVRLVGGLTDEGRNEVSPTCGEALVLHHLYKIVKAVQNHIRQPEGSVAAGCLARHLISRQVRSLQLRHDAQHTAIKLG